MGKCGRQFSMDAGKICKRVPDHGGLHRETVTFTSRGFQWGDNECADSPGRATFDPSVVTVSEFQVKIWYASGAYEQADHVPVGLATTIYAEAESSDRVVAGEIHGCATGKLYQSFRHGLDPAPRCWLGLSLSPRRSGGRENGSRIGHGGTQLNTHRPESTGYGLRSVHRPRYDSMGRAARQRGWWFESMAGHGSECSRLRRSTLPLNDDNAQREGRTIRWPRWERLAFVATGDSRVSGHGGPLVGVRGSIPFPDTRPVRDRELVPREISRGRCDSSSGRALAMSQEMRVRIPFALRTDQRDRGHA